MSKRRKQRSWSSKFRRQRGGINPQRPKLRNVEKLEDRYMFSVDPIYATPDPGGVAAAQDRRVETAFKAAANLAQYSSQQLDDAAYWVVRTDGSVNVGTFFAQTGLFASEFSPISDTYIVSAGSTSGQSIVNLLSSTNGVEYFYPGGMLPIEKHSLPNDPHVRDQWHLRNTGQIISRPDQFDDFGVWGADVRAEEAWKHTTGEGVVVAVIDDGLEYVHPDIGPNYDPYYSYDFKDWDPFPHPGSNGDMSDDEDAHGTAVAGIIGAAGDNGAGVTGVAYDATIGGIRLIGSTNPPGDVIPIDRSEDDARYGALTYRMLSENGVPAVDIYNNSWGFSAGRIAFSDPTIQQALNDSAFFGRDGLGSIQVFSSGNDAQAGDNANHSGTTNSPYTISVAGFDEDDVTVPYAEGGPSVFVTAPTGNSPSSKSIFTTDLRGEAGYNQSGVDDDVIGRDYLADTDYTQNFNGTSAAAPAASGVIALIVGAARDNGIELTMRDVQHILARSSRKIDPTDFGFTDSGGWQTNTRPFFTDPLEDAGVPIGDQWPTYPGGDNGVIMASGVPDSTDFQYALSDNGAGFFVHDGFDYGYGHGAIDAKMAVELAQNWVSVGNQSQVQILSSGFNGINVPAAELVVNNTITIPGGVGGLPGFGPYFDLWLAPPPDLPDPLPVNTRGAQSIPIVVPANYGVEWIEVSLNIAMDDAASSQLRLTLVSPDGTHSELTNWERATVKSPLGFGGSVVHTFTTNRHWGERTEGVGTINPITGDRVEPFNSDLYTDGNGVVTAGEWQLVIENWSTTSPATLDGIIDFHVTPTETVPNFGGPDLGGRIQGSIGLDINQDDAFNFTGVIATEDVTPTTGEAYIISSSDTDYEPMVGGIKVWVETDGNGMHDPGERYTYTSADGNYYFDLPWNPNHNNSLPGAELDYYVHFDMPTDEFGNAKYDIVGNAMHTHRIGIQNDDSIAAYHVESNFVLQPKTVAFEGNVFADFDLDGVQDFHDATVEEFRVFVDINENGVLDYRDINLNGVFDNGVDTPLEPMEYTAADGSFSVEMNTGINVPQDFFGNVLFLNDYYVGAEYYNLMVDYRDGWAPTGDDITAEGFAGSLGATPSPSLGFRRVYFDPAEAILDVPNDVLRFPTQLDFGVAPDLGSISGFVFKDVNQNGTRESGEEGLDGFTIYLDADNSINPDVTATFDTAEHTIITGANGNYLFENLAAGEYDIYVMPGPGYTYDDQTHPIGRHHLNRVLAPGQQLGDGTNGFVSFGFYSPSAPEPNSDWGDLGGTFLTTSADGGPSHGYVAGFHLGSNVTPDADGQPDTGAGLDANDDGVTFSSPIVAGELIRIDVEASTNVLFLQGWVDFNNNGAFDADEHLQFLNSSGVPIPFAYQPRLDTGMNELYIRVPDSVMGNALGARFRYGEGGHAQFNKPNGPAILGEVEDYMVAASVSTSFTPQLAGDYNNDNVVDQGDYQYWKQAFRSQDLTADGNGDGRVSFADYSVWRDNLGAVALPVQTIMAPLVAAPLTVGEFDTDGLGLIAATVDQASVEPIVASSNDATTTESVDFYYYELEMKNNLGSVELLGDLDAGDDEALVLALEEEFGDDV